LRRRNTRWSLADLKGVGAPPRSALDLPTSARVLGLDPGSLVTGYALIECFGAETKFVTCGSIRTRQESLPNRLAEIFQAVASVAREWQPQEIAIERVFVHRNVDSALKLGQARGAALCGAMHIATEVFEYSPREVKQAVVGNGSAQKEQVQLMVKRLLNVSGEFGADAADALAIAMCHAHSRRVRSLLAQAGRSAAK
jgi:crossover junction endodeoxyribonuclease RuvC